MSEETELVGSPKVIVKFKTSSTKGGQEAYEISVTDAATDEDKDRARDIAFALRREVLAELAGQLERDLEESVLKQLEKDERAWEASVTRLTREKNEDGNI